MTALEKVRQVSLKFRSAILAGDHVLAGELAPEYALALRELWELLPENERAVSSVPQDSTELLTWAHRMTVVQRAIAKEQLAVIEKASHYQSANSPTVQLSA